VRSVGQVLYLTLAILLVLFGFVAIFSIGAPLLVLGLTLLGLFPYRSRATVFWPWLSGVISFFVGYVLVAPLHCSTRQVVEPVGRNGAHVGGEAITTCFNLLGIDYSGVNAYNPPLWPALLAGLALAGAVAAGLFLLLRRRA
jgi:hypothetical protein